MLRRLLPHSNRGLALFVGLFLVQLLLYREAFSVLPSMDDYTPPLAEIRRGDAEGPLAFFRQSLLSDYRPFQALTIWSFSKLFSGHEFLLTHVLHFVSFLLYALVGRLWIRWLRLPSPGDALALAVLFLHPLLAGPLASIDGFARLLCTTWTWLGAYLFVRVENRTAATALLLVCFVIALGYAEYAVTLLPLTVVLLAWRDGLRRAPRSAAVLLAVVATFGLYLWVRTSWVEITDLEAAHVVLCPLEWAKNLSLILASALFFGDTCYVALHRLTGAAWLAVSVLATIGFVAGGIYRQLRPVAPDTGSPDDRGNTVRALRLVLPCLMVSTFPAFLLVSPSEMYLTGVVIPVALLMGIALSGWVEASTRWRAMGGTILAVQLVFAATAVTAKVHGLKDAGERSGQMMSRLLEELPPREGPGSVALVFVRDKPAAAEGYSVFAVPDHLLLGSSHFPLDWHRPGHQWTVTKLRIRALGEVPADAFDCVLVWDGKRRRFDRLAPAK